MNDCSPTYPLTKGYPTIYVERAVRDTQAVARILSRLPNRRVLTIDNYRDVFGRPRQDMRLQKEQQALILARKEPPYLYEAPPICQSFGHLHHQYVSFLLGCPFICDYCFLQGMHPSGHLVAFVNTDDYLDAMTAYLAHASGHQTQVSLSYDTDLLACDALFLYLDLLQPLITAHPHVSFEVRTKSASTATIDRLDVKSNLIWAYSLAPQSVISAYEPRTPPLEKRLIAARKAMDAGWPVRLCFDPIFAAPRFFDDYLSFFKQVFTSLPAERILDVGYGFFRMNKDFFRRIRRARPDLGLFYQPFDTKHDTISFAPEQMASMTKEHLAVMGRYIDKERIYIV